MKNFTSILGWLLLVAVLAVPSFLFYNWLSKSKLQNQAELVHEPIAGSVFPSDKNSQAQAASPLSSAPVQQAVKATEPAPAIAPEPAAAAPAARQPASPAAQSASAQAEQPPSASSNPPAAVSAPATEPEISTAPAQSVTTSTGPKLVSYYNPKGTRDPTFTPDDYRRLKEEQMQREEAERMQLQAERNKPKEAGPEVRISLQGIVGSAAIINGDMYSAGQTVRGIKILKVGSDYIIAEYKGKKFRKVLR